MSNNPDAGHVYLLSIQGYIKMYRLLNCYQCHWALHLLIAMWLCAFAIAGFLQPGGDPMVVFIAEMAEPRGRGSEIEGGGALAPTLNILPWHGASMMQRLRRSIPLAVIGSPGPHTITMTQHGDP
jgi:hypothetical protein